MDRPQPDSFRDRLKDRKVVQWSVAYLSAAWLILQVVDVVGDQFDWPGALQRGITVALAFGFLAAVILAWFHGEKGHQRVTRTESLLLAAVVLFAIGAVVAAMGRPGPSGAPGAGVRGTDGARPGGPGTEIAVDPDAVAVLPFVPPSRDPRLDRLGRDLAVTVSATLDGIDGIRTVDALTVLAQLPADGDPLPLEAARDLARRLGAGRFLRGSLTREGAGIRVDATLHGGGGAPTRASTTVRADAALGALTDSVSLTLLRGLWTRPSAELPSPAALETRSADALRAYVQGEEALSRGEMPAAVAAFERAFAHDSTYWFAYWRSLYPRIYEGSAADSAVMARIFGRRARFPPADRLLLEAYRAETVTDRLEILREATRRFPTHWPSWFTLGNLLIHGSPPLGTSYSESRAAMERVLALNPRFAGAVDHLFWITVHQRDTTTTRRLMDEMASLGGTGESVLDPDALFYYGTVTRLVEGGGRLDAGQLDAAADYIAGYAGPIPPRAFGTGLLIYGFAEGAIQVAEAVLERGVGGELATGMWRGKAYAWAGRGAWDSAAVAVDRWTRADGTFPARVRAYGLLAAGAALGAVDPAEAARVRPGSAPGDAPADLRAELAWLDGLVAWSREDATALRDAARRLAATGGRFVPLMAASLEALELRLAGRGEEAVAALTAAEEEAADLSWPHGFRHIHPYVPTVDRVLLGRWLLEAERPADAERLLSWNEAVYSGTPLLEVANRTVGALGYYERARAEERMGLYDDASTHYRRFLETVDRPVASIRPLVEDARNRLRTLSERLPG